MVHVSYPSLEATCVADEVVTCVGGYDMNR
jgi:hypothetical protein